MSGNKSVSVIFLNHWAGRLGGAEYSLGDILECAASKWDCHLVTTEKGPLIERAKAAGIKCHVFPIGWSLNNVRRGNLLATAARSWKGLFSFFWYVLRARSLVNRIDPLLIHANVPKSHVTLMILKILGYKGKCCLHIREIFHEKAGPIVIYRLLFRARNTWCITISHAVKLGLPGELQATATVIHNGVTIANKPRKCPVPDTIRFIYLGRIVPWKGCCELIYLFSDLLKQCPHKKLSLSLVGDTLYWTQAYRENLQKQIHILSLANSCTLLPQTDNPLEVLAAHDVFCMASYLEPFGRVVAEAQGCGLPVVAWNSGGINEIVEDGTTGLLVTYGDKRAYVNAMKWFVDNPELINSMGETGRRRTIELFDKKLQVPEICDYLEEIIKK
ncbi:MAG: glycosyltransferase [Chitinivibrionales bacterium]|nr:glycosyltransferase [Chitinivibrionales bacterium]